MTMIISANLGDALLIAADKRSMLFDLKTEQMRLFTNEEEKIKLWGLGAVAGSGETVFINRVMDDFYNFSLNDTELKQIDFIYKQIHLRLLEGLDQSVLINNTLFFSIFNGIKSHLYSIPIQPFIIKLNNNTDRDLEPLIYEIKAGEVDISCFNLPPDLSNLKNFQNNLKALSNFKSEAEFLNYYIENLSEIFATHAVIDCSISTSFDLYIQNSHTGESVFINVSNPLQY